MPENYQYHVFGLNICSSLELPDLNRQAFLQEDVRIVFGENPSKLSQVTAAGVLYQASKDQFLFTMDGVASFHIQAGHRITIDMAEEADANDVCLFLLGPVFGALLLQRGLLPLHGSSVEKNGSVTIICGQSGAGKSTLAALFLKRGFTILADDISLVDNGEVNSRVTPGITKLKLWEDVIQQLFDDYSRFPRVREQLLRYKVNTGSSSSFRENQLKRIVILEKKNTPGFEWNEIFGMQKFGLLKENTYRGQYIKGLETSLSHFRQLNALTRNVKVYLLRRPNSPLLLNELADFVEEKMIGS